MLNIAFAIYAGETRYNIVRMTPYQLSVSKDDDTRCDSQISQFDAREYRIFSQIR
jgi:hypothetical protein